MTIDLAQPRVEDLAVVVAALRQWQVEGAAIQLHPGDLGWAWQLGPERTAAAVRTWARDGRLLAVGFLDGPGLVRLGIAPDVGDDDQLAQQIVADVTDPGRDVLPEGPIAVEARFGVAIQAAVSRDGWTADEPWTPLRLVLSEPVQDPGLRVEAIGPDRASECTAVHRSAFGSDRFTDDLWHAMATGPAFADARCLVGYDDQGAAVATATAWSAGPGRPGLLEPVGVHAEHRGHGYGTAISLAAAAALQEMGASSATVATESSRVGAVRTYLSAGYEALPEVRDFCRAPQR